MKHFFTALLSLIIVQSQAQVLEGSKAHQKISGTDLLRYEESSAIPTFIRFANGSTVARTELTSILKYRLGLSPDIELQEINHNSDKQGILHERFRQLYKGIEVEGSMFLVHSQNQQIKSLNGDIFSNINLQISPAISATKAVEIALAHTNAQKYAWESDPEYSYPSAQLVIAPRHGDYKEQEWRLCYKMDVYAEIPLSRNWVFVDAKTGEVIWELGQIHVADAPATGTTRYSGVRNFTSDSYNGSYRLREAARSGIETKNMNKGTNYATATDFTDADNNWTSTTNADDAARDAHWGAEETYDYYLSSYNRNSIDGNGMKIRSFIHYGNNYQNAFWNGQVMTFGDGAGNNSPFTPLDVMAHELTHGVTGNSAQLQYQKESGALNESFSDIFGTAVEFYAKPTTADWLIADAFGSNYFRSMANPKLKSQPDTYLGDEWINTVGCNVNDPATDKCGVHTNSGVQNKWYHLASVGGTGTNDNGDTYNVTGVGVEDAAAIAYRTLTDYLTPTSNHYDARFYSIISAVDLFGPCTPQVAATTNAWYAVGVGAPYQPSVIADFMASQPILCKPGNVLFSNLSGNATTFKWNFGDGTGTISNNNSTITHNYTANGTYNVTLIADGGTCGIDTTLKLGFVDVGPGNPCIVNMPTSGVSLQTNCTGIVYDDGGPLGNYADSLYTMVVISPTNAYKVDLDFSFCKLAYNDSLFLYDGNGTNAPLLGSYTLSTLSGMNLSSSGGTITVLFQTTGNTEDSGFVFNWACHTITAAPVADFMTNTLTSCDGLVQFYDQSTQGGANWQWDFGDGATLSNVKNPKHEYLQNGTYTVKLTVSNTLGTDDVTKTAYVTVNRPPAPSANDALICANAATLVATPTNPGEINWFSNTGAWLGTGDLTIMNPTSPYIAKSYEFGTFTNGGRLTNAAPGSIMSVANVFMTFDVTQECMLHAVDMYAGAAGNRTIVYADQFGTVLGSRTVYLKAGKNKVILNFPLSVQPKARLSVAGNLIDLYRNVGGSSYPYAIGSYLSIKGPSNGSTQQYFYFYNWEIADKPCISLGKSVNVVGGGANPTAQFSFTTNQNSVDFNASASTNAPAFTWDFGDGTTGTGISPNHVYTAIGTYTVTLTAVNGGCTDVTTQTIEVISVGIEGVQLAKQLQLFPNPGNGTFTLKGNNLTSSEMDMHIFNHLGQEIFTQKYAISTDFTEQVTIPTSTEGIYWIQMRVGDEVVNYPYSLKQ